MTGKLIFETDYDSILKRVADVDPVAYGRSRNFIDGAVTYLSPYISRGVISTKQVMAQVLNRGYAPYQIEKFLQELAWRDYWQQIWIAKGDAINSDLKHPQPRVDHHMTPVAISHAKTGIEAIDKAIRDFYKTGYIHNHIRMYIAAITCNMAYSYWKQPAQWMYYHLLDGDWASNALSWQWVAGTTRSKVYVANQENINKYCKTTQTGTFLDVPYSAFDSFEVPEELFDIESPDLTTPLPEQQDLQLDPNKPVCIYNFYNLDPNWRKELDANRILLIEPDVFEKYPVCQKSMDFMLSLAQNIPGIQVYTGSFGNLKSKIGRQDFYFKEHPLNQYDGGIEDARDWMFSVNGYFPSFFAFWKRCKKELKNV